MAAKKAYQDSFKVGRALFHMTIKPNGETNFAIRRAGKRVMIGRLRRDGSICNVSTDGIRTDTKAGAMTIDAILKHVAAHAHVI